MSMEEFHRMFFEEAHELLETMESELLEMVFDPDNPDRINNVFRAAHSIKGGAAAFGFSEIAATTHVMETVMNGVRDGAIEVTRPLVDLLLSTVDVLGELLASAKRGEPADSLRVAEIRAALEEFGTGSRDGLPDESRERVAGWRPADRPDERPADADPRSPAKSHGPEPTSIRVGTDRIDALINVVGELVITQSILSEIGERGSSLGARDLARLREGLLQLQRHTRELQDGILKIRMVPIANVFDRLPRTVHDLTARLGKKVDLVIRGEQTELDKTVLERIGDPLMHLVRNAVDHGIEAPARRAAAGKPECGVVELSARHANGDVVITIRDDGAGLDTQRIVEHARRIGLIPEDHTPPDREIQRLIFHPGFSTADQVSDVSGRGVGMDVVQRNVRELGGSVEIESAVGAGSTFAIRLPLTLAIIDGQVLRVGNQVYVLPLSSIVETIQLRNGDLDTVAGRHAMYHFRGEYVPVMALAMLLDLPGRDRSDADEPLLVLVDSSLGRIGLLVDDLLAQQQVVVKGLESNYRSVPGVSGATVLGDGRVALILDAAGLIRLSGRPADPRPSVSARGSRAA